MRSIDKIANRDGLQYTCTRLLSLGKYFKTILNGFQAVLFII